MKTTHGPLKHHGDADDYRTTLTHEDFGDRKPVPQDARDKQRADSKYIIHYLAIFAVILIIGIFGNIALKAYLAAHFGK